MVNKDYVLRVIEEAIGALSGAQKLRVQGQHTEAVASLDRTSESMIGLSLTAVMAMPLASLLEMLQHGDKLDAAKVLTLAQLIQERGLISDAVGENNRAHTFYRRALAIYDAVTQGAPNAPELLEHAENVQGLLAAIKSLDRDHVSEPIHEPTH